MEKYTIGVISDTHGLLRPEIFSIFSKVNLIIHAGDIGRPEVLSDLNAISSTIAVLGNVDSRYDFPKLKLSETVEIMGYRIYVTHNRQLIRINPREQGIDLVIFGHSHQPLLEQTDGVVYFNPGIAGPRRFSYPITAGIVHLTPDSIKAEHIKLKA